MQRSTHYHPSWCSCSISPYCALGLQAPWDAAVYHSFWNEKILLKSLSHTGFPCSSPLNSLPLLLLASTTRRELQDHTAKGWHLQGTLTVSGLFYWKMQSVIKYLSSHLTSEAQGVQSASGGAGKQLQAPLQRCLQPLGECSIPTLQLQAALPQEPSAEGCTPSLAALGMQTPPNAAHTITAPLGSSTWLIKHCSESNLVWGRFTPADTISLLCNSCGTNSSGYKFWSFLSTAIYRFKYLFNWGVIVVLEWQGLREKKCWLIRIKRTLAF